MPTLSEQQIADLYAEFDSAQKAGIGQNESRYGQLLADAQGNAPRIYNESTGQWEDNAAYQAPLSYNQRIDDLTGAGGVYSQAQGRFDQAAADQRTDLNAVSTGLGNRATSLGATADGITDQQRTDLSGVTTGMANRATTLGNKANANATTTRNDYSGATDAFNTRANTVGGQAATALSGYTGAYGGPGGILSGYDDRSAQLGSQVSGVQGELASAMSGLSDRWGTRESELQGLLSGYGDIQRDDLNRSYDALSQQQQQQMRNSGLGNSTVMSSVMGGVENQRQLDRSRLEDQLRREQLGYQGQWSQESLGAQEREAAANAEFGMAGVDRNAQYGADALGAREGFAGNSLNAGFDLANLNAGMLGDAANSQMTAAGANTAANQNALNANIGLTGDQYNMGFQAANANTAAAQNALNTNLGLTGDYYSNQQQSALANANMGLQAAGYADQVADVRNQLTSEPLRAIEAREDLGPSLQDVGNLAMQIGQAEDADTFLNLQNQSLAQAQSTYDSQLADYQAQRAAALAEDQSRYNTAVSNYNTGLATTNDRNNAGYVGQIAPSFNYQPYTPTLTAPTYTAPNLNTSGLFT